MTNNKKSSSPLPAIMVIAIALDILIALNLFQAILLYFIVLFSKRIKDFSLLPTVLLVSTIFGLALNISSVRHILVGGAAFDGWAIRTVASLVAGPGEITHLITGFAGFIVFAAIVVLLITKGATFIAEVTARFTPTVVPIKMMAVEAEYSSGSITEEEAQKRKTQILKESDFYGAMDGAAKFISGNVKITLFLMFIIIAGGIAIDTLIRGISITDAAKTYILLSIANGILFLLPNFLVLIAASFAIIRSVVERNYELIT